MKENILQSIPATVPPRARKRSGVSIDRAFRIQAHLERTVWDIYNQARSFKLSHDAVCDLYIKMRESTEYKKAPKYVHSYISGYRNALADEHYNRLEWRLSYKGKLLSPAEAKEASKTDPDFYSHCDADKGRHTYIGCPDKVF